MTKSGTIRSRGFYRDGLWYPGFEMLSSSARAYSSKAFDPVENAWVAARYVRERYGYSWSSWAPTPLPAVTWPVHDPPLER